ncbi:MAG: cytochrome c biogenesis protein CcsA [Muribaculaceae bacterium]
MAGILMLAMIAATIVEKYCGSTVASQWIYHSPLTMALWASLLITAAVYVVQRRKAMTAAALLLHAAFAVILVGAAVTHYCGVSGTLTLTAGDAPVATFTDSDGLERPLPFDIRLINCEIQRYPGTTAPSDYVSRVELAGGAQSATVSMNRVAGYRGYRFFQTGISDSTSTLSVQHDPAGIAITYCGYAMLCIAMVAMALRRPCPRRRSAMVAAIALASALSSAAASSQPTSAPMPRTPDRAVSMRLGTLMVSYNGRIAPVSVMARDFCLKVHGSATYRGLQPEEVLAGWLFFYDEWKREPFIRLTGDDVKRAIGVDARYAALTDFYDYRGYKLQDCEPTPGVMQAHERTGLISAVCTGAAFKIYPIGGGGEWVSWVSARPSEMSLDDWRFVRGSMEFVAREIAHNRHSSAWQALGTMRERQRAMAGDEAPSPGRVKAEVFYARHVTMLPIAILAFLAAGVGIMATRRRRVAHVVRIGAALVFVAIAGVMGLRCYISGTVPLSNGYETMLAIALCASGFATFGGRTAAALLRPLCLLVSAVVVLVAYISSRNPAITSLTPVLASPLLCVHVALVMAAYTLLAIIAANAAAALAGSHSAERTAINVRLLTPAVMLLAAGIFTGAVWANQSWGRYWGWDPKETWALITMMVYALPLHRRSWPALSRRRRLNIYLLVAFASVIITYVGVNYLLGGLHSYA